MTMATSKSLRSCFGNYGCRSSQNVSLRRSSHRLSSNPFLHPSLSSRLVQSRTSTATSIGWGSRMGLVQSSSAVSLSATTNYCSSSFPANKKWNGSSFSFLQENQNLKTRQCSTSSSRLVSSSHDEGDNSKTTTNNEDDITFKLGDPVHVEVVSFGPLGASVEVIGMGHDPEDIINDDEPALGYGLISQQELHYFRQARDNLDVVKGEILKGYVERVRPKELDGKLGIALRTFGGKGKAMEISEQILNKLQSSEDGILSIGDKSSPEEINAVFPGTSKSSFKKAVSALYKQKIVQPSPKSITLIKRE